MEPEEQEERVAIYSGVPDEFPATQLANEELERLRDKIDRHRRQQGLPDKGLGHRPRRHREIVLAGDANFASLAGDELARRHQELQLEAIAEKIREFRESHGDEWGGLLPAEDTDYSMPFSKELARSLDGLVRSYPIPLSEMARRLGIDLSGIDFDYEVPARRFGALLSEPLHALGEAESDEESEGSDIPASGELARLARSSSVLARECVARDVRTPPETLDLLGYDDALGVVVAVADNKHTPTKTLRRLANHADPNVRAIVIGDSYGGSRLPPSVVIDRYFEEDDRGVRRRILQVVDRGSILEKARETVEVLDEAEGYELLMLRLGPDNYCPYLEMVNASTGKKHLEGVHPDCRTVEDALIWRNSAPYRIEELT